MPEIKKNSRSIPANRTNMWCTCCKKEGHFSHDCQADWRMIQEEELPPQELERLEMESLYAIQQGALRGDLRARQGGVSRVQGTCWECGGVGHYSPMCPNKKPGEYILLCSNCREEGHKASQCPKPTQARIQPRYVPTLPKEQTAMNWGNKAAADQPEEDPSSNVRLVQEYKDVRRVSTRRNTYDRTEGMVNQEEPESDEDNASVESEPFGS